jgi:hypothetical protein
MNKKIGSPRTGHARGRFFSVVCLAAVCAMACGVAAADEKDKKADPYARLKIVPLLRKTGDGTPEAVNVKGETSLPDDSFLYLEFIYSGEGFQRKKVFVREGRFEALFGPYARPFYSGLYKIKAVFLLGRQMRGPRERLVQSVGEKNLSRYRRIVAEEGIYIGVPEREVREEEERKRHYAGTLKEALGLFRELALNYLGTSKTLFYSKSKKGYYMHRWIDWLKEKRFFKPGEAQKNMERHEKWFKHNRFVKDGIFLEEKWRKWLDDDFRLELFRLFQSHQEYRKRAVAPRYPRCNIDLEQAIGLAIQLSYAYSREIYRGNKRAVHEKDRQISTINLTNLPRSVKAEYFFVLLRSIAKRIGLKKFQKVRE